MAKTPASIPAEGAAYEEDGARRSWLHTRGPVRHTDTLRTLAIGSALILAIGATACASEEDTSDTGELPNVEASPPAEAPEEAADETSPAAEEEDEETSEAEGAETSEAEAE